METGIGRHMVNLRVVILALLVLAGNALFGCGSHTDQGSVRGPVVLVRNASIGYTQLAMNSRGDALVSWRQSNGSAETIHATYSRAAGTWDGNKPVSINRSLSHRSAVSEDGDGFVVWQDYAGGSYSIRSNHHTPGADWDGEVPAETHTSADAIEPWIATSPTGTTFVVWRQYNGSTFEVRVNQSAPGAGWGTPELLASLVGGYTLSPSIAVDPSGDAIAVWIELLNTSYSIHAKRYQAGSGWDTASTVIGTPGYPFEPHIGMDNSGNAIVIWGFADNGNHGVQTNRYEVGTGWTGPGTIIELPDTVGSIYEPQIAVASDGTAFVAWEQSDGSKYNIWADHYAPGQGWTGSPVMVSDSTENSQSPQVAVDAKGHGVVAWRQIPVQSKSVWAAYFMANAGWSTAKRISEADDTGVPQNVNAGMDSNGNALVVWDAYNSATQDVTIWACRIKRP